MSNSNQIAMDRSLVEVLGRCGLKHLPEKDTKEFYWVKAIGLVCKSDGSMNYAILRMGEDLKPTVVKDFGNIASIVKIKEIYPFIKLEEKWIPVFKTQKEEDRLEWLRRIGDKTDYSELTLKALERVIIGHALRMAWDDIKNR